MINGITYAVVATADGIVVVDLADPAGPIPVETAQNNSTALYDASAVKDVLCGRARICGGSRPGWGRRHPDSVLRERWMTIPPTIASATMGAGRPHHHPGI